MTDASKTYAIHPAIGIARMGDAALDPENPATFYLGAEAPYQVPNQGRAYKTGGRIRKQAQRFRIYEYQNGVAVREITLAAADVAAIEWTVHLANRKAALNPDLSGCPHSTPGVVPASYVPAKPRNVAVGAGDGGGDGGGDARRSLVIDPGAQSIRAGKDGADAAKTLAGSIGFPCNGATVSAKVTLGTIAAERDTGRLLVFAADGISRGLDGGAFTDSAPFGSAPDTTKWTYANSDGWYDDSADGRVQARVRFADGTVVDLDRPAQAAWVICTMPRFAPSIGYFTTLHDLATDAVASQADLNRRASFMKDIYPILASASQLHWVNITAAQGHGTGKPGDYSGQMMLLADNDPAEASAAYQRRHAIFSRLRPPGTTERNPRLMPKLSKDVLDEPDNKSFDIAAFTRLQYAMMQKWRDGAFVNDFDGSDPWVALESMSVADRPAALDRGALDGTAGTPLYPGIESWKIMREPAVYAAPLRVSDRMRPGDLTMGNALPWQADFLDCTDTWWPVQRPNYVRRSDGRHAGPWIPPAWGENNETPFFAEMVRHWSGLGFIVRKGNGLLEDERSLEG